MTTAADLTPYEWPVKELTEARVAWICALMGNAQRMTEHLETLPMQARRDLAKQAEVFAATARKLAGITPMPPYEPSIRHDSIKVPCGRCGHEEWRHRRWSEISTGRMTGTDCFDCPDGRCAPVKVPVGVEGWKVGGRGQ